jgi:hypothetical protein
MTSERSEHGKAPGIGPAACPLHAPGPGQSGLRSPEHQRQLMILDHRCNPRLQRLLCPSHWRLEKAWLYDCEVVQTRGRKARSAANSARLPENIPFHRHWAFLDQLAWKVKRRTEKFPIPREAYHGSFEARTMAEPRTGGGGGYT